MRHAWSIYRLNRGVGDTVFYDAADRPWFRLDEQRRDVPLDPISTYFKDAVIAVEAWQVMGFSKEANPPFQPRATPYLYPRTPLLNALNGRQLTHSCTLLRMALMMVRAWIAALAEPWNGLLRYRPLNPGE